jgi:hypothetical protein
VLTCKVNEFLEASRFLNFVKLEKCSSETKPLKKIERDVQLFKI